MSARTRRQQSGQAMVLVAVVLVALIGSAALVLLAGSVEWQKNQLQELADQAALDAASRISNLGIGCSNGQATAVIRAADNFLAGRRVHTGPPLAIAPGTCATPYRGTDTFAGPIAATINYPYRANQQQVEVILTLNLPIAFGGVEGIRNTAVTRRALAQGQAASVPALQATTIDCQANAQMNVQGSVLARNLITSAGNCAIYAHGRFDPASRTWSDFGDVSVSRDGQVWIRAGGRCVPAATRYICADGYELSGTVNPACGGVATEFLSAPDRLLNPDPCAAGVNPLPAFAPSANLPPDPILDANATTTLREKPPGGNGVPCVAAPGVPYPPINVAGMVIGTGLMPTVPIADAAGFYHFTPSCYGYLDISRLPTRRATLDAGFYYFNGSGFAGGGGGICLNGTGQLVGRDVTMEFVRNANFNSGSCAGGAAGAGTFGVRPCSSTPCPPAPVDGINNTWLAAPCSTPPSALDVNSCRGGASWCPVGDRACWNRLIWAPAAIAGRFQVASGGARAWLLGSVSWPGNCFWGPNGVSAIDGAVACGLFRFTNGTSNQATLGSDAGVNTALTEALLVE